MANKIEEQKFTDDDEDRIFADDSIATDVASKTDTNEDDEDSDEAGKVPPIKLKHCINVNDMMSNKGFIIEEDRGEPDGKESARKLDPSYLDEYFARDLTLDSDEGDDDDENDENAGLSFDLRAQKMVDLLPNGGVKKKLKTPGLESAGSVPDQAAVTVHYSLWLEGGDEPFDTTRLRGRPERFKLGCGHVIFGLEIAIKSMKKTEISEFIFNPEYAFGMLGCPPRIPGKAKVFARVELIDFVNESEAEALLRLLPEERNQKYKFDVVSQIVGKQHVEGNRFVEQKEWKLAAKTYDRGCKLLEDVDLANDEEEKEQKRQLNKLYLNLGYCYIKISKPNKACSVLDKALKIDRNNVKANFRMGIAKKSLGNYPDARKFLDRALRLDPQNNDVGRELVDLDKIIKTERDNERALCARMFGGGDKPLSKKLAISDETYEELVSQIDDFKQSPDQQELTLPSGMSPDEVLASRRIAQERGLKLIEIEKPRKKLIIVKE